MQLEKSAELSQQDPSRGFSWRTGILHVLGNVIGTGVFVCLAYQVSDLTPAEVLFLWLVGGFLAIFGALSYSELSSHIPHSGGEYTYLTHIFGKPVGFLSAWVSSVAGFAAPVAASSYAAAKFLSGIYGWDSSQCLLIASVCIIMVSLFHTLPKTHAFKLQNCAVILKLLLIGIFIGVGLLSQPTAPLNMSFENFQPLKGSFAVALIFVGYAYSGWNSVIYFSSEIRNPKRNIPLTLVGGTLIVTLLYFLLNFVFLRHTPLDKIDGNESFAFLTSKTLFGAKGAVLLAYSLALSLVTSVSAMIVSGAEMLAAIGRNHTSLRAFGKRNANGQPAFSLGTQALISLAILYTMSFEKILVTMGMLLTLSSLLCIYGLFMLRRQQRAHYECPGYPYVPLAYVAVSLWVLAYSAYSNPDAVLASTLVCLAGLIVIYFRRIQKLIRNLGGPSTASNDPKLLESSTK